MRKILFVLFIGLIVVGTYVRAEVSHQKITTPNDSISLDFQDIEVRKALQILAKFLKLNVLVEDSVQGKISLNLSNVSPKEAMDAILTMHALVKQQVGNTWIIKVSDKKSGFFNEFGQSLSTKRIVLQHRKAQDIAVLFKENEAEHINIQGSKLSVDNYSNSLWIKDTKDRIQMLEQMVSDFDRPVQQVLIEARIVSIDRSMENTLGARFGLKNSKQIELATPVASQAENDTQTSNVAENANTASGEFTERTANGPSFQLSIPDLSVRLPISYPSVTLGVPLVWSGINKLLDLELSALESEGTGRIISSPRVITLDRVPAVIESGSEIPYQEKSRAGTSVAFKKAVLSLQVTPELNISGKILLKLHVMHDKPNGAIKFEGAPAINTQSLKTEVLLASGETVVLGGIYENAQRNNVSRLPILGRLPIVGALFSYQSQEENTHELFIFVTPHVVSQVLSITSNPKA